MSDQHQLQWVLSDLWDDMIPSCRVQTDLHCAPSPTRCAEENVNHVDPTIAIKANARMLIDTEEL